MTSTNLVAASSVGILSRLAPVLCVAIVLLIATPLMFARPAHLTSDESLYLAEAYNIAHGEGLTYPSGDPVVHRAPLFPALLAPAVRIAGPHAAYSVTKAIIIINALLVLTLAWRIGGMLAGLVAGVTASGSAFLNGLGTTVYLDPFQCTFLLLAAIMLHSTIGMPAMRTFFAAGCCVGFAFLVKESAIQWAPLGLALWLALPSLRNLAGGRGAVAFSMAFAAIVAPWWLWVWFHSDTLFMLGPVSVANTIIVFGALLAAVALTFLLMQARRWTPRRRTALAEHAPLAAALLMASWSAFLLYGLTRYSGWPYPNDYFHTLPSYMRNVAPQAQPYFLMLAAWGFLAWRAFRRDEASRLLCVAGLLFLPFAVFIANRGLQLRDALPLIYLSYATLGIAAAAGARSLLDGVGTRGWERAVYGGMAILCGLFVMQQAASFRSGNDDAASLGITPESWDSRMVTESAAWMNEHLPEGAHVLSSRLYFSSLHVHTDARFRIFQLPTVRVEISNGNGGMLVPRSNLFRWGETRVRQSASDEQWIYLKRFPSKKYWVSLSQQELMEYIDVREIEYVVLTGDDVAFSSMSHTWYFSLHPAAELLVHQQYSPGDQFFVYRIDRAKLHPIDFPTVMTPSSFDALTLETGRSKSQLESLLATPLHVLNADRGFTPAEQSAFLRGEEPQ